MTDLVTAVREHTALHNDCVQSGVWDAFIATYTEDATMTFASGKIGPLIGRENIGKAIIARPNRQVMTLTSIEPLSEDTVRVVFRMGDRPGEMVVGWRDGMVCSVTHHSR